ncbi:hypothetical protein [Xanthomonas campestris]|jgi:hypothetical protein|uniref:hypothetical protein n=1 Tax=Xanthomonas campestris TaxID=339 RepID=UPI0011C07375|nr:hypothetical protein [Xanthomonas campestris]MEA9490696.1 hypothetical protein [Xanthomonas campestris]MEA9510000.1 hypothetical protein [Xanthomonas campestris]MEA9575552.1 hypothetical protein [Xanthomonas campestris]MEB2110396.1 hypothetical protein [Xanthomonas campestris pv. campestris]
MRVRLDDKARCELERYVTVFLPLFACDHDSFVSKETASHRESDAHGFCEANNHMWALVLSILGYLQRGLEDINRKHKRQVTNNWWRASNKNERNLYELENNSISKILLKQLQEVKDHKPQPEGG